MRKASDNRIPQLATETTTSNSAEPMNLDDFLIKLRCVRRTVKDLYLVARTDAVGQADQIRRQGGTTRETDGPFGPELLNAVSFEVDPSGALCNPGWREIARGQVERLAGAPLSEGGGA